MKAADPRPAGQCARRLAQSECDSTVSQANLWGQTIEPGVHMHVSGRILFNHPPQSSAHSLLFGSGNDVGHNLAPVRLYLLQYTLLYLT
jgi:hypothetical protein